MARIAQAFRSAAYLALVKDKPKVMLNLRGKPVLTWHTEAFNKLGIKPAELLRKKEPPYKELKLVDKLDDDEAIIKAMTDNPVLIERPIVVANNKAAIGRPPENILDIL